MGVVKLIGESFRKARIKAVTRAGVSLNPLTLINPVTVQSFAANQVVAPIQGDLIGGTLSSVNFNFDNKVSGDGLPIKIYSKNMDLNNMPSPLSWPILTTDFLGKISGSLTVNPNISYLIRPRTDLALPTDINRDEWNDTWYPQLATLNGSSASATVSTSGQIPEQLFAFNLITVFERQYGTMPGTTTTADKVAWLKANVTKLTYSWYGYGVSPFGYKANSTFWTGSVWYASPGTNTASSPALINGTQAFSSYSAMVDASGFVYYLAYGDMAMTTSSTFLYATAHGLLVNDLIENVTRGLATAILTVPTVNTVTHAIVTGQVPTDSIKKFHRLANGTAIVGTTTTNLVVTAHGLATGDWVYNSTRGGTWVKVTVVDANTLTCATAIVGQVSGDSIALYHYYATQAAEATVASSTIYTDYMSLLVYFKDQATVPYFTEVTTQASLDKLKVQDSLVFNSSNFASGLSTAQLIEVDLSSICSSVYGGSNASLKTALSAMQIDAWFAASGALTGIATGGGYLSIYDFTSASWGTIIIPGTGTVSKITASPGTQALAQSKLSLQNKVYALIYPKYPSDGTLGSIVSLDYINIRVDLTRIADAISPVALTLPITYAVMARFAPDYTLDMFNTPEKHMFGIYKDINNYIAIKKMSATNSILRLVGVFAAVSNGGVNSAEINWSKYQVLAVLFTQSQVNATGRNIALNGDFSSGIVGWTGSSAILSATGSVLSVIADGSTVSPIASQNITLACVAGHKVYISCMAMVTNSVCTSIGLEAYKVAGTQVYQAVSNPVQNTWYPISAVLTEVETGGMTIVAFANYASTAAALGKVMQFKQILVIDLTVQFGPGNEPTPAWCVANLPWEASNQDVTWTIRALLNNSIGLVQTSRNLILGTDFSGIGTLPGISVLNGVMTVVGSIGVAKNFNLAIAPGILASLRNSKITGTMFYSGTSIVKGTTNYFIGIELAITYSDSTMSYFDLMGSNFPIGTTPFTQLSTTFSILDKDVTAISIFVCSRDFTGTAQIKLPKWELGMVATAWTPAPEDMASELLIKNSMPSLPITGSVNLYIGQDSANQTQGDIFLQKLSYMPNRTFDDTSALNILRLTEPQSGVVGLLPNNVYVVTGSGDVYANAYKTRTITNSVFATTGTETSITLTGNSTVKLKM